MTPLIPSLRSQQNSILWFVDINGCLSVPCQNGGTCTDWGNSYTCSCNAGYTGTNCETSM